MIIVNPLYDVSFKQIMENNNVAKFFVSTILNCEVIELAQTPQERIIEDAETKKITLFRMDFSAKIKLKDGTEKSVIIELQKAKHLADITRFRRYLGKEYINSTLPIISIYILGFDLSVDSPAFMSRPDCWDLRTNERINSSDSFVGSLTHNAYFIQTKRIKPCYQTKLDNLLSIFEQANFIGETQTTKGLNLTEEELEQKDPELKEMVRILQRAAANGETLEMLKKEQEYLDAMEEAFGKINKELSQVKREKESLAQKNKELIRKMKQRKVPVEEIADIMELSIEEIECV